MDIKKIEKYKLLHAAYLQLHYIKQDIRMASLKRIPESKYPELLQKEYKNRTGKDLDWKHLVTYNEKMQWDKIYNRDPRKTEFSDKFRVRKHIARVVGEQYLVPILGQWDSFDEIDFEALPNSFVLKMNNGSNTNIIVKDKAHFDKKEARKKFKRWMKIDYSLLCGFEMQYRAIKPKIIAEKYIETSSGDLWDYKFLCFNGKVYFIWVDVGRYTKHKRNVYDKEWNLQPWNQFHYGNAEHSIDKPQNLDEMINIAEKLAADFSHVRIDLYNADGKIYFSEMTFTNGSGFEEIVPEEYGVMLGDLWHLK